MSGDWMAAIAARLLRDETFTTTVVPALADLQFEARSSGRVTLARSYVGVARALALAGLADLRGDVATAFAGDTFRGVWLRALAVYAALAAITTTLVVVDMDARYRVTAAASTLASATVGLFPVIMSVAALALARRGPCGRRSIAAATALVMIVGWAIAFSTRPVRNALVASHDASRWLAAAQDGSSHASRVIRDRSLPELADAVNQAQSADLRGGHYWSDVRIGANVPAMALIGLSLSSSRGWMIAARLLMMAGGWLALAMTMMQLGVGRTWPEAQRGWRDVALVLIVALVSLTVSRVPWPKRVAAS